MGSYISARPARRLPGGLAALLTLLAVTSGCGREAEPQPVEFDAEGVAVLPEEEGTRRITPEQVAWLQREDVPFLFVDSRGREAFAAGRPAGSVSVPLDMTDLAASRMPGDRLIVTFCT
ncbi:MAG: rhodanese-like domain-containing protein [Gemmatimonadota bacterium]